MANTWTFLLPSYTSTSRTSQILMTRGILSLFLITTLLVVARATPESNIIYKRQASPYCNNGIGLPNGSLYCEPAANDTYTASSTIKFAWNTEDGEIKTKGLVDVYLYRNDDFALVYSDIAVDNNIQILPIKVNSSCSLLHLVRNQRLWIFFLKSRLLVHLLINHRKVLYFTSLNQLLLHRPLQLPQFPQLQIRTFRQPRPLLYRQMIKTLHSHHHS